MLHCGRATWPHRPLRSRVGHATPYELFCSITSHGAGSPRSRRRARRWAAPRGDGRRAPSEYTTPEEKVSTYLSSPSTGYDNLCYILEPEINATTLVYITDYDDKLHYIFVAGVYANMSC